MFLFKKKQIELIACTEDPNLAKYFPVIEASKALPNYYKTLGKQYLIDNPNPIPNSLNYESTIRRCYGINEFNKSGFILPLWADYSILIDANGKVSCVGAGQNKHSFHHPKQYEGALENYHMIKLVSPWNFVCKEDVHFLTTSNFYANEWTVAPGIIQYCDQTTGNLFVMIRKTEANKEIFLSAGTMIEKIIPLTDRPVKLKIEVVDNIKKYFNYPGNYFFHSAIQKLIRQRKRNNF